MTLVGMFSRLAEKIGEVVIHRLSLPLSIWRKASVLRNCEFRRHWEVTGPTARFSP